MQHSPRPKRHSHSTMPMSMYYVLLLCVGIFFVGCSSASTDTEPEFVSFTAEELEKAAILQDSGSVVPTGSQAIVSLSASSATLENLRNAEYEAFFANTTAQFVVNNPTVNVRSAPTVQSSALVTLQRGAAVDFIEFVNAAWAKIRLTDGREAFVTSRYITRMVPEDALSEDKKQYEGMYFINFDFINVRRTPDTEGDLLGTLPGQTLLKPLSLDDKWARIQFEGKEAYIAKEYLAPFEPAYSVRQSSYTLPVVTYDAASQSTAQLQQFIVTAKQKGMYFLVFEDLYNLLKEQQVRDVRLPPNTIILALTNITSSTIDAVSDVIYAENIKAVGFIATSELGIDAITERKIINVQANGLELQSGTHLGDDLRSLTSEQVRLEMDQSKLLLEELIQKPIRALYYPFGASNERITGLARDSGYLFGITQASGIRFSRSEFLALPTIPFDATKTPEQMLMQLQEAQ
jgi:uncharacterized protein YgiM (DUF1202 family)